jgi:hypothetical protein
MFPCSIDDFSDLDLLFSIFFEIGSDVFSFDVGKYSGEHSSSYPVWEHLYIMLVYSVWVQRNDMKDLILRNEACVAQYKPRKMMKQRLVLRDEHGRIGDAAQNPCQERKIIALGARIKLDPDIESEDV